MFLQLYDKNHHKIAGLAVAKAATVESVLSTGDGTLSFLYPIERAAQLVNEAYIRTKTDEYIIKEVQPDSSDLWCSVKATLNVEDLEGICWPRFESVEQRIDDCLKLAIAGTGWTIGSCTVNKRRTIRKTECSGWDIIQQARKTYRCEIWFDTIEKKIHIAEKRGQDKGMYFTDTLNLRKLAIQSTSYDFCTRIKAEGKDGLTFKEINGGKDYVENHQYSNKVLTKYWKDERYTNAQSLLEDTTAKLEELSKPVVAYSGDILDLAKASPKTYRILDFGLGDTVELVDSTTGTKEKQRIVKMVEYPDAPEKNTCEFANRTASFEELQQEQNEVNGTVNNITADDGTISPSALDLDAISIHVQNIYAQELNAVKARIGDLETTTLKATEAIINTAMIEELLSKKATILDLNALTARVEVAEIKVGYVDTLVSDVADIKTLVNGNLTSVNIQAGGITSDSLTIRNGFITNAMIGSVEAGKITTGILNTSLVTVQGADGRMAIKDNTIQIKDASRVRVQIGKDAAGDYSMYVWDANGALMFDAAGLHAPGIKSGIIRNDMVADNAGIAGTKIDITSLITSINGNTTKIDSTVIKMDSSGQTLNLAFNTLKTTAETAKNATETHTTQIGAINGKIDTLIQDTTIIRDGQTVKLKDEYNKTVATVGGIQTTIGNQQTTIANLTNDLNNLTIGGRNYILNTAFLEGMKGFLPNQSVTLSIVKEGEKDVLKGVSSQASSSPGIKFFVNLDEGGKYLFSFIGKGINTTGYVVSIYNEQATKIIDSKEYTVNTASFSNSKTLFNVPKAGSYCIIMMWVADGTEKGLLIQGSSLKLEKGNKPTDWTPAPEDTHGQITEVKTQQATFKQTLDGFSTTVSSLQTAVSGKADAGTVNTLNSRVTSLETNLDGFKTTVSSTYQTKNIPDTRNTNQPPSWYFTNYPHQTATEFKNRATLGAPGGATYGTLTTHISWGDKSGGYPTQVFKSSDGTFERVGTSDSAWSVWKQVEDTAGAQNKADTVKNYVLANYSTTTVMNSAIDQKANQITLSVSQTYTTKTEFNNSAVKQFNNFSRTGNLTGWSPAANASGLDGVKLQSNSTYNWVGAVTTSGNIQVYSDFYEVDANKSYKLGLTINKPAATGSIYFGITCYNASKQAVGVYTGTSTTLNTNFYYYYTNAVIGGWLNLEGYLMASNIDRAKLPAGKNVSVCAVMHPTTKYVRIRFLNYYNNGTSNTMYFAHPFITDAENSQGLIETRVSTAEQKITPAAITNAVTSAINGGQASFQTASMTLTSTGLTVDASKFIVRYSGVDLMKLEAENRQLALRATLQQYNKSTGYKGVEVVDNKIYFYDHTTNGNFVGGIASTVTATTKDKPGLSIYYDEQDRLELGYKKTSDGYIYSSIELTDKKIYLKDDTFLKAKLMLNAAGTTYFKDSTSGPLMHFDNTTGFTNNANVYVIQIKQDYVDVWRDLTCYKKFCTKGNVINKYGHENNVFVGSTDIYSMLLSGNPNWYIHCNTHIGAYGINIWASDGRMKANIQPTQVSAVDEIAKFKHRAFQWKDGGKFEKIGYIAQELEQINPDYVERIPQKDTNGNVLDYRLQINEHKIIPLLTKAVQELTEENKELRRQIQYILQKTGIGVVPAPVSRMAFAAEYVPQYPESIRYYVPPEPEQIPPQRAV